MAGEDGHLPSPPGLSRHSGPADSSLLFLAGDCIARGVAKDGAATARTRW